jgi:hypothetical protein
MENFFLNKFVPKLWTPAIEQELKNILSNRLGKENSLLIDGRYGRNCEVFFPKGKQSLFVLGMIALGPYSFMWGHQYAFGNAKELNPPSIRGEEDFLASIVLLHSAIKVKESGKLRKTLPRDTILFYMQICQDLIGSNIPVRLPFKKPDDLILESVEKRLREIIKSRKEVVSSVKEVIKMAPVQVDALKDIYKHYLTSKKTKKD